MLGKRRVEWVLRLLVADAAVLLASFLVAYGLRVLLNRPLDRAAGPLTHYLWLLELIVPVWLGLLAFMGGYGVGWTAKSQVRLFTGVSGIGLLLLSAALFLEPGGQQINRSLVMLFAAVSGLGLWAERGLVQAWLRRTRHGDRGARVALVVGTGERAGRVISALRQYPEAGWAVRGCVSMDPSDPVGVVGGIPVIGSLSELPDVLQAEEVLAQGAAHGAALPARTTSTASRPSSSRTKTSTRSPPAVGTRSPTTSAWMGSSRPPRSTSTARPMRPGRPKSANSSSAARTVRPVKSTSSTIHASRPSSFTGRWVGPTSGRGPTTSKSSR